ncbi:hypothetical protein NX345_005088 [Salmonella enterica]|nr:hypothetical protein [Salmonella enterica]
MKPFLKYVVVCVVAVLLSFIALTAIDAGLLKWVISSMIGLMVGTYVCTIINARTLVNLDIDKASRSLSFITADAVLATHERVKALEKAANIEPETTE